MAKARVICTCNTCGATFTQMTNAYNRKEADKWEEWAQEHYTECPECWAKRKKAEDDAIPFICHVDCDPYHQAIIIRFSGNTMPLKDRIKALGGYRYGEIPDDRDTEIFSIVKPKKGWYKEVSSDKLEAELKKAASLNPVMQNNVTEADIAIIVEAEHERDAERAEMAAIREENKVKMAELVKEITPPIVPAKLSGKKWNHKVYGRVGNYCFYSNDERITLTDEEAADVEQYLVEKEAYDKKVAEVKEAFDY